jgi:hypothetical protein
LAAPWRHGAVKHFWKESPEEVVLKLELTASDGLPIGTLALYQRLGSELLIDTDLIKGHLRDAVATALCNSAKAPKFLPVTLPVQPQMQPAAYLENEAHLESPLI